MSFYFKVFQFLIFFTLLFGLFPSVSLAWNKLGHMTVGAIAYQDLNKTDSTQLKKLVNILKKHPDYEKIWKDIVEYSQQDEGLILFMYASRWADDLDKSETQTSETHYIDYPYVINEGTETVKAKHPKSKNIETTFKKYFDLFNTTTAEKEKAKALAWLFHLIGDAHQPLHSISLFSKKFKKGDEGGKNFRVKFVISDSSSLHYFWDSAVINGDINKIADEKSVQIIEKANYLLIEFPKDSFSEKIEFTSFPTFINESYDIAKNKVYQPIILDNPNLNYSTEEYKIKMAQYEKESSLLAEKRLTLAGYRLANICNKLATNLP